MKSLIRSACATGLLLTASHVHAQVAGTVVQPQIDPGRVQERLQPLQVPESAPQIVTPEMRDTLPPEQADRTRITVREIRIEGAEALPPARFDDLTRPLIGREIALTEAFRLADAITARYRAADYILSRAIVPVQRIEDGVLRIRVVEGYVSKVAFDGPASPLLDRYAAELTAQRPLRGKVLERYLLLMNDLPGLTARAVVAPAPDAAGGSLLTIVSRQKAFDGYAGFDNHGSRYIGPLQYYAGVAANDALGLNERIALNYAGAAPLSELQYVSGQVDLPIGHHGLLFTTNAGYSHSRPGFVLKDLHALADGTSLGAQLAYPLIRSRARTLRVSLGFRYLDSRTVINGTPDLAPSSNDHIRSLRLGLLYDFADRAGGHNIVDLQLSRGLGIFGALDDDRPNPSRPFARNRFTKLTAEISRRQTLDGILPGLGAYGVVIAQTSFGDSLFSSEQFGVGGSVIGTAYDPSEITGDKGVAGRAELQYSSPLRAVRGVAQFYGFYDIGTTHNERSLSGEERNRTISSAGGGVRLSLLGNLSAFGEIAKPLERAVQTRVIANRSPRPTRLFAGLTVRY